MKVLKATELCSLKWLIYHYVNCSSIKQKFKINVMNSENVADLGMMVGGVAILKHLFFLNQGLGLSEITLPCQVSRPNTLHHSQQMDHPSPDRAGERSECLRGPLQRSFQELKIISWRRIMC